MIGYERVLKMFEPVLEKSKADDTEIVYIGTTEGLTRYANSAIHQNVHETNNTIFVRSIIGKKTGVASTNSLRADDLRAALTASYEIAKHQPENPDFPGLPGAAKYRDINTFDKKTASTTPMQRARLVKRIISRADDAGFTVAGALATSAGEIAVLNTRGVRAYQPTTTASVNMIVMSDDSSGYAAGVSRSVSDMDFDALARRAVDKCASARKPREIDAGEYEIILEPAAAASLLEWMNYIGFGSKAYEEKTSFLAGKIGKKIISEKISVYDDALDTNSVAFPFDFEGVPKKKVSIIDKGVAKGVVFDRLSAKKNKTRSTGHALTPNEQQEGALAMNLFFKPGTMSRDTMIGKVKKGLMVTRFHYINGLIDTRNAVMTGMTRDGTFLIENGEIVSGVKNLRFTDSMLRAFSTTVAVSRQTELVESWWSSVGCISAPTIHLGSFRFSGKTSF